MKQILLLFGLIILMGLIQSGKAAQVPVEKNTNLVRSLKFKINNTNKGSTKLLDSLDDVVKSLNKFKRGLIDINEKNGGDSGCKCEG